MRMSLCIVINKSKKKMVNIYKRSINYNKKVNNS